MTDAGRLLALDTATRWPLVALGDADGRLLGRRQWQSRHGHAEQLLPMLDALLEEAGTGRAGLRGVIVGTGPGSFTGLRIGLATAKVLAYTLTLPIVGIPTARALARAAGAIGEILVSLPAGAADRYVARYRATADDVAEQEPPRLVARPDEFAAAVDGATLVAVDLEADDVPPAAAEAGRQAVDRLPAALLELGAHGLANDESEDVATLVPAYVALPRGINKSAEQMRWSPDLR